MLVDIYSFLCSFTIVCFGISFKMLEIAHLTIKTKSYVFLPISKHPTIYIYIYPRRKKYSFFIPYMAFYVLCWTYMSPICLLIWLNALYWFYIHPLFQYILLRKHQFLKELLRKFFLTCLIRFLCVRVIFC